MELTRLRSRFDAECAAFAGGHDERRRRTHAWRIYEICCAYEQILADLYFEVSDGHRARFHRSAAAFADVASGLAGVLAPGGRAGDLDAAVGRARAEVSSHDGASFAALSGPAEAYVRLPECFMRDLLDLDTYTDFVGERLADVAPTAVAVVGLRTTGSYLAPVWDAALRNRAIPRLTVTARPKRDPRFGADGRVVDAIPDARWVPPDEDASRLAAWFGGLDPRTVTVVVVDDLAFTGSQFVRTDNYFQDLGVPAESIVFVQNKPLVMTSLTPTAFERLAERPVWSASRTPDGPERPEAAARFFAGLLDGAGATDGRIDITAARLAPPTFTQRHLSAATTVPVDQFVHFNPRARDRHHLLDARVDGRPTRLFAKVLGTGLFGDEETRRIREFGPLGYRVIACRGGFLFYEWIDGQPLGADEAHLLTDDDIDGLAEYAALLGRLNAAGSAHPDQYADDVVGRLRGVVDLPAELSERLTAATTAFVRGRRRTVPMVDAPRNQGHWHHIRTTAGRLRRVHLDLGEWSWRMEVAEELAATVVELGLSARQTKRLVDSYAARTGDDDVVERMAMATVSYVARVFDQYRFWAGQIEQVPNRFRRPADGAAAARRPGLMRALETALGDGVTGDA